MKPPRTTDPAKGPELSTEQELQVLADEILARYAEVRALNERSAELAGTDGDASVNADMKAQGTERLIARRLEAHRVLFKRLCAEATAQRTAEIDAVCDSDIAEAQRMAAKLRELAAPVLEAARALQASGMADLQEGLIPRPLVGRHLLSIVVGAGKTDMQTPAAVETSLAQAVQTFVFNANRARAALRREAAGLLDAEDISAGDWAFVARLRARLSPWSLPAYVEPKPAPVAEEALVDG